MEFEKCLILAAGLGTRMGAIGKELPKILWPVFDLSLIELQVAYARYWGAKRIYINLHFQLESVRNFLNQSAFIKEIQEKHGVEVNLLEEKEQILGVGGAIHNLQSVNELYGKLLVIDADQFLFFDPKIFTKELAHINTHRAVLFGSHVPSHSGYSITKLNHLGLLEEIVPSNEQPPNQKLLTYAGMGFIDLDSLDYIPGPSSFFTSVADYKNTKVKIRELDTYEYWDFGTVERYKNAHFNLIKQFDNPGRFHRFLRDHRALDESKLNISKGSYGATSTQKTINFSKHTIDHKRQNEVIILDSEGQVDIDKSGIYYMGHFEGQ